MSIMNNTTPSLKQMPVEPLREATAAAIRLGDHVDCWEALDEEERQIALMLSGGSSAIEISHEIGVSSDIVESSIRKVYQKLDVELPDQLMEVVYAFEL